MWLWLAQPHIGTNENFWAIFKLILRVGFFPPFLISETCCSSFATVTPLVHVLFGFTFCVRSICSVSHTLEFNILKDPFCVFRLDRGREGAREFVPFFDFSSRDSCIGVRRTFGSSMMQMRIICSSVKLSLWNTALVAQFTSSNEGSLKEDRRRDSLGNLATQLDCSSKCLQQRTISISKDLFAVRFDIALIFSKCMCFFSSLFAKFELWNSVQA